MYLLPSSDINAIAATALQRLTKLFPILNQAKLSITIADVLMIDCRKRDDLNTIAADDVLMRYAYLTTGCNIASLCLEGTPIKSRTQLRLIQLEEGRVMATKTLPKAEPIPGVNVDELSRAIAEAIYQAIYQVMSGSGEAKMIAVKEAPPAKTEEAPIPRIRIARGAFVPAKSNWMQSAKRYLRAVDPQGTDGILKAIIDKTPLGEAHLNKALSYLPRAEQETARDKFYQGFVKVEVEKHGKS